ncbi:MAG: DoxX family protein [Candidatus Velthaea sp.]
MAAEGVRMTRRSLKETIPRVLAAALFLFTGTQHFLKPAIFVAIVPPMLPAPGALVAISGAAEISGGLGLLFPQTRRIAVYGLIALLLAVFPANIYMAVAHEKFASFAPLWLLIARLPLQLLLIAWIWRLRHAR